jgi:hypothetical protein
VKEKLKMNTLDKRYNEAHLERECKLHGRCGKDIPLLTLMEITVFGLNVLSKTKKTTE